MTRPHPDPFHRMGQLIAALQAIATSPTLADCLTTAAEKRAKEETKK